MTTHVTFRHFKSDPGLQNAAMDATKGFEKYFDGIISSNVIFKNEKDKAVEFTVHVQGNTLVVEEKTEDFLKSLNIASDKMVRQLKKWKEKMK